MAGQKLEVHLFVDIGKAEEFVSQNKGHVLQGPKQLVDFDNRELAGWTVVTFSGVLNRFRLLEKQPLFKLLPPDFIRSWIEKVASPGADWFKVIAIGYRVESGWCEVDKDGLPKIDEIGIELVACPFRNVITQKVKEDYPDPCLVCHKKLAKKVFDYTQKHKGEIRLLMSDLDRKLSVEHIENLSETCWTGLVSVGLPILVFDVVVGIAVLNPKWLRSAELTTEEETERGNLLDRIEIGRAAFGEMYGGFISRADNVAEDLEGLTQQSYWAEFRNHVNDLQSLAQNRYGQGISSTVEVLEGSLQKYLHEDVNVVDFTSEPEVWDKVGEKVLWDVARFFSFKDLYVFGGEDLDSIRVVAAMSGGKSVERSRFGTFSFEGKSPDNIKKTLLEATGLAEEAGKSVGSPVIISVDNSFWYVFGNRRHTDGSVRRSFNPVCAYLMGKTVRSLHAEIGRILLIHRNLDNVIAMTHNLKSPVAQLANAQQYYDAVVYGRNATMSTAIFAQNGYLKKATEVLYDAMVRARRKVEFEANKLRYGRDIKKILKRSQLVPIIGEQLGLIGEPLSFWGKAVDSVKTFAGSEELSSLRVATFIDGRFKKNEFISIDPEELQVLLDNLSDNAVKYSFEGRTIDVELSRQERDGKDCICYSISSFGNGIDESERGKIGTKFYRGRHSSTRTSKNEGTGLGVYTIDRIVQHVDGKWDWESHFGGDVNYAAGEGYKTTFSVWLPIHIKGK